MELEQSCAHVPGKADPAAGHGAGRSCAQCSVWLLSRMKISKWKWSSISVSAQLQLKGTLALLLVGNAVFVIAQVRVSWFWEDSGL